MAISEVTGGHMNVDELRAKLEKRLGRRVGDEDWDDMVELSHVQDALQTGSLDGLVERARTLHRRYGLGRRSGRRGAPRRRGSVVSHSDLRPDSFPAPEWQRAEAFWRALAQSARSLPFVRRFRRE